MYLRVIYLLLFVYTGLEAYAMAQMPPMQGQPQPGNFVDVFICCIHFFIFSPLTCTTIDSVYLLLSVWVIKVTQV